jgi:hypothetical protein
MRACLLTLLLVASPLFAACSRSFPAAFPRASAASPDAAEATPARVDLALVEEPPLPGEHRPGWDALERDAPAGPRHGGHHHAH